jgi:glycosyltransferase involved in cell wall biosynthesis
VTKHLKAFLRFLVYSLVYVLFFTLYVALVPLFRTRTALKKAMKKRPRILWGPTPIINIATNAAADAFYGYESHTIVYETYYITKSFTYNLEEHFKKKQSSLYLPLAVMLWATWHYDIFQFFFDGGLLGRTEMRRLELPLLRMAGKKIIVSTYGADVRVQQVTRALGAWHACMHCRFPGTACVCDDAKGHRNVEHVGKYAHTLLSMGDMNEYVPGSRKDIYFWAIDPDRIAFVGQPEAEEPFIIVHAPNHREYKGTDYLVTVIEELKAEGHEVELLLVEKVSNEKALERYRKAHIVAEQFIIGWHGYFAVEAMALGKPVVAYIRKPQEYLPADVECPIVSANPDTLRETLLRLMKDRPLREELGKKGRLYVEKVHSFKALGKKMDALYRSLWGADY